MNTTLIEGDKVLVCYTDSIERNEIALFKWKNQTLIKRCIGLPGETIVIKNSNVLINNKAFGNNFIAAKKDLNTPITARINPRILYALNKNWTLANFGPYIIPKSGLTIMLDSEKSSLYKEIVVNEIGCSEEFYYKYHFNKKYTFKSNYFFMLGDNRDFSEDSRIFGAIRQEDFIGKGLYILYSKHDFRNRLLKKI